MLLRCRCRALLSRPPLNRTPHIKHYSPAYRGTAIDPFASTSPPASKKRRPYLDPDTEAQEFDDEDKDAAEYLSKAKELMEEISKPEPESESEHEPELFNQSRDPDEEGRPERKPKRGLESVDRKLSNKDLGLYSGPRQRKRDFIRWMVTSGSKHEFFPQSIAVDLESRRVERMRKRAEERMFQQMNNFFNSLSEEEITQGKLITPKVAGKRKERPIYPQPSPFQQIVGPLPPTRLDTKEIESVVLRLLKRHNRALHAQYREYINWSDYKLQKQNLFFKFPDDRRSPGFGDVVSRLVDIEESGLEAKQDENITDRRQSEPEQGEEDVKIPSPEALDELLRMEAARAENSEPANADRKSPVDKSTLWQSTLEHQREKSPKVKEKRRENADLAYYLGPPLPLYTQFPTIPIYKHHYVNPTKEPTPFLMNPTFKPWRPIPHSTRLKMFDAWRAGLGLRNVSWLGGVSWRRVDGIIGILKKEWEFVEKGGKLEDTMAEYMDALLSKTPVIGRETYNVAPTQLTCFRIGDDDRNVEDEFAEEAEDERIQSEIEAVSKELKIVENGAESSEEQMLNATAAADENVKELGDQVVNTMGIEEERELIQGLDEAGIRQLIANGRINKDMIRRLIADETLDDETIQQLIAHAKLLEETKAPDTSQPITIFPQFPATNEVLQGIDLDNPTEEDKDIMNYIKYFDTLNKIHAIDREWETSHKEPLVEIPVRRTAQYWAIIQEMEEYSEKRAAQALEGLDGRTMTEKEEGIKLFERYFGGLRSLGGRERYQGTPPWEMNFSDAERRRRQLKAEKLARTKPGQRYLPATITTTTTSTMALSPAERFRQAKSTDLAARPTRIELPKERVVWRFEDVSWVKQRTIRPRKTSFVGTLDKRVRLESGMARYGPFGIGSGTIEGVGGVKHIIERGLDGNLRVGNPPKEKERVRREIVV